MDYPIRLTEQLRTQLRALRKERGVTQVELGHWLGVGQARIAEIERSPGTVSFDQLLKLLSLLGAGLVLRDSLPAGAVEESNHKLAKKPAKSAKKQRPVPSSESWTERSLNRGSVLVSRVGQGATTTKKLNELRRLNPDKSVAAASARHYVIRPKKGSW